MATTGGLGAPPRDVRRHGEIVVPVAKDEGGVIATGERRIAVARDDEGLLAASVGPAASEDTRGTARARVDPRDAVIGGAKGGADLERGALDVAVGADDDEDAPRPAGRGGRARRARRPRHRPPRGAAPRRAPRSTP